MINKAIKCCLHNVMFANVKISSQDLIKSDIAFYML